MSNAHGHEIVNTTTHKEEHTEEHKEDTGHAKTATVSTVSRMDPVFENIQKYVTGTISTFVAFLFLLIALGAFYALAVTGTRLNSENMLLVLAPAIVGLIAYSSRDIAMIMFFFFVFGLFFLF